MPPGRGCGVMKEDEMPQKSHRVFGLLRTQVFPLTVMTSCLFLADITLNIRAHEKILLTRRLTYFVTCEI